MTDENKAKPRKKKPAQEIEIIPPSFPFQAKKKIGRPSNYDPEIATEICTLLAEGKSLNEISKMDGLPCLTAIYNWLRAEPSFASNYARAKEDSADTFAAMMIDAVNGPFNDALEVNVARLKLDAYKWIACKLKPRSYGDRVQAALTGADGGPIQVQSIQVDAGDLSPDARDALRAALLTAVSSRNDAE